MKHKDGGMDRKREVEERKERKRQTDGRDERDTQTKSVGQTTSRAVPDGSITMVMGWIKAPVWHIIALLLRTRRLPLRSLHGCLKEWVHYGASIGARIAEERGSDEQVVGCVTSDRLLRVMEHLSVCNGVSVFVKKKRCAPLQLAWNTSTGLTSFLMSATKWGYFSTFIRPHKCCFSARPQPDKESEADIVTQLNVSHWCLLIYLVYSVIS